MASGRTPTNDICPALDSRFSAAEGRWVEEVEKAKDDARLPMEDRKALGNHSHNRLPGG
jgi:hypothetical protein